MIHYIKRDLLESDCDYICHQVNCKGKMNSGIAKAIREKWPVVYDKYRTKYESMIMHPHPQVRPEQMLGDIQTILVDTNQYVVNFFSQENYGYDGKRYTSYDAFWNCLNLLKEYAHPEATIAFPYKIGCVRGGANWRIIKLMIMEVFKDREVFLYYLNNEDLDTRDKEMVWLHDNIDKFIACDWEDLS